MPRKSKLEKKPKPEKKPTVVKPTWELIGAELDRFAVPGGWIFRSVIWTSTIGRTAVALCFVPFSTFNHGTGEGE